MKSIRDNKKAKECPDYFKQLGERIKALRMQKGYTSHELFAYEHDFNRTQYGRYERGEDLRFSTLLRIIEAFDMTVTEFFSVGFE